jgi:hypothetical protein
MKHGNGLKTTKPIRNRKPTANKTEFLETIDVYSQQKLA